VCNRQNHPAHNNKSGRRLVSALIATFAPVRRRLEKTYWYLNG
jgi:hypothetical protein